jgi:hypothetical protein
LKLKAITGKMKVGKTRARQMFLMIISLVLIFAGLPYALHLVQGWNDIVPGGSMERFDEHDFYQEKIGQTQGKIGVRSVGDDTYTAYTSLNSTLWATGSEQDVVILENPDGNTAQRVYWFFNFTLSDLISKSITRFEFNLTFPVGEYYYMSFSFYKPAYNDYLEKWYPDGHGQFSSDTFWTDKTDENIALVRNSANKTIEFTTLDLMIYKAEYGDGRGIFTLANGQGEMVNAESVSFAFELEKPSSKAVKTTTVLQIGAVVIGIILSLIAVASTSYWNPIPGSKPGIIDKWFMRIGKRWRRKS